MTKVRTASAFTLIELMIVIAIIAIIAAMAIPAFMERNSAKYSDMVGTTFDMNGIKVMVISRTRETWARYDVVILPTAPTQQPVKVEMDRDPLYNAYLKSKAQALPEFDKYSTPR